MSEATRALQHPLFRRLFAVQVLSLLGTGMATIALALMVYDLHPGHAGAVLGSVFALKMVAYITVAPVVGAYAHLLPRRQWLSLITLGRAILVALLPFADSLVALLSIVFLLNAMTACFTPVYQALLPDVLTEDKTYIEALSLSRAAMDIEALLSPVLASIILLFLPYTWLFEANAIGFVIAATILYLSSIQNATTRLSSGGAFQNITFGTRAYLATPRLKGALCFQLAMSAAGAMVIVNTVVYAHDILGLEDTAVTQLLAFSGLGSLVAAYIVPKLLSRYSERQIMKSGAIACTPLLLAGFHLPDFSILAAIWCGIGFSGALVSIPSGKIVRDSCSEADRNAFFSANFALTHAGWLLSYVMAGFLGQYLGLDWSFICLAALAAFSSLVGMVFWKRKEDQALWHVHSPLDHAHPHVHDEHHQHEHEGWEGPEPHVHEHRHSTLKHRHVFHIDEHHIYWPK